MHTRAVAALRPERVMARPLIRSSAHRQKTSTTPSLYNTVGTHTGFETASLNAGTRDGSHRHDPLAIGNRFFDFPIDRVRPSSNSCTGMESRSAWTAKGSWKDNVFIERFWRTLKYEEVYLRAYESVSAARQSITRYLAFYNGRRPHTANDDLTPDVAYFGTLSIDQAA